MWHCHVFDFYCFWTDFWPFCCFWTVFGLDLGQKVDLLINVTLSRLKFWANGLIYSGNWSMEVNIPRDRGSEYVISINIIHFRTVLICELLRGGAHEYGPVYETRFRLSFFSARMIPPLFEQPIMNGTHLVRSQKRGFPVQFVSYFGFKASMRCGACCVSPYKYRNTVNT